jgi:hypothetical protein
MLRHSAGMWSVRVQVIVSAAAAAVIAVLGTGPVRAAAAVKPDGGVTARLAAISCTSAGSCAAAGFMSTPAQAKPPGQNMVFLVSERNGVWGKAEQVPGLPALQGGSAGAVVSALSCSSAGNCSAGGTYTDQAGQGQAFVVTETNGVWADAEEVPGLAALNTGGNATITQMSCTLAGGCLVAGTYETDSPAGRQAFVVQEIGGVWGTAEDILGLDALNTGGAAQVRTLYCVHTGNCTVGGDYNDSSGAQPFVAYQNYGEWYSAQTFPDIAAANTGLSASIDALSCQRRGICTGVGTYRTPDGHAHAFSVSEQNYIWNAFQPIPGMTALPQGGAATSTVGYLSCPTPGNCTAGGKYTDPAGNTHSYLVTQTNGTWGNAQALPGLAVLKPIHSPVLTGLSCRSPGNCTAIGSYSTTLKTAAGQIFVLSETNGKWGKALRLPRSATLSKSGKLNPQALSCGAPGSCTAGGTYTTPSGHLAPFLATQKNGIWANAQRTPGTGP